MKHAVFIGGDARQYWLAANLQKRGWNVIRHESGEGVSFAADIKQANVVILPVPATKNGTSVWCANESGEQLLFSNLLSRLSPASFLLGGLLPQAWINQAESSGIHCADYYREETVQLQNALPSAEGALQLAMRELPVTLCGTQTAVTGYGRIGSLLCEKLVALGAQVGVLARSPEALVKASLHGAQAAPFEKEIPAFFSNCRILFNTVPQRVLTEPFLRALPSNCVLIELASAPGGFDAGLAEKLHLRVISGGGLPGRFYPETAGNILAGAVCEILNANGFMC